MLVHICCSIDSHFFLQELRKALPNEQLTGFFYDPNIHPFSEYELRYFDVLRSCKKLKIKLIKGEYDYESWLKAVKGLENEPEKGKRCDKCFDVRLEKTAKLAQKLGEKTFTTTLLCSPKKDLEKLKISMQKALQDTNLEFFCFDFRKNGGTQRQLKMARENMLYHQNYCGCFFALMQQKSYEQTIKELSQSAIRGEILPGSVQERLKFFKNLAKFEEKNIKVKIIKEKFLNYRLLYAKISDTKSTLKSFLLFYSHFKSHKIKMSLNTDEDIVFCNKDDVCIVSFKKANEFFKYKNFYEFCKNPPSIKKQISYRKKLFNSYNLSPIIILEKIPAKIEIFAKSIIFEDSKNIILKEKNAISSK